MLRKLRPSPSRWHGECRGNPEGRRPARVPVDERRLAAVAAAILAAVEGGILPPGMATLNTEVTVKPARQSAGQDARLYGRRDARRYAEQIPGWSRSRHL